TTKAVTGAVSTAMKATNSYRGFESDALRPAETRNSRLRLQQPATSCAQLAVWPGVDRMAKKRGDPTTIRFRFGLQGLLHRHRTHGDQRERLCGDEQREQDT